MEYLEFGTYDEALQAERRIAADMGGNINRTVIIDKWDIPQEVDGMWRIKNPDADK
jgi:hypothetical protein